MSQKITTIEKSAIEYLCGLINQTVSLPSEIISDINLGTNQTFSSVRIDTLLNNLKTDCNDYTDKLVSNLSRLKLKIVTDEADINEPNVLYLHKPDGATSYNQYVVIEGNKILLGTTDISMTDYYTITQADAKFCLLTDYNSLKTAYEAHKDDTDIHTSATEKASYVKKADIKTTLDENSTDTDICSGKAIFDAIKNSCVSKETVLYEGEISATGTYTLADDVNNYDLIVINHRLFNGLNCQSLVMSKVEISKCIDSNSRFICAFGFGSENNHIAGFFNNNKVIIDYYVNENITSITGYKIGQATVQDTITNSLQPISYSTDEQLTGGTWIDGKPIYRKVLLCTTNTVLKNDGNWKDVPGWSVIIPNVNQFVRIDVSANTSGNRLDYKVGNPIQFFSISSYISLEVGSPLVLEYTKTTDA